jgi:hypothetical protein
MLQCCFEEKAAILVVSRHRIGVTPSNNRSHPFFVLRLRLTAPTSLPRHGWKKLSSRGPFPFHSFASGLTSCGDDRIVRVGDMFERPATAKGPNYKRLPVQGLHDSTTTECIAAMAWGMFEHAFNQVSQTY